MSQASSNLASKKAFTELGIPVIVSVSAGDVLLVTTALLRLMCH